ncbi:hypothetical protein FQN54_007408 [Arachnomyces sp. PD_36]|nr:hypothetical protein FQN54_007408 [Arachnomyces sp. PD_36]
MATTPSMKPHHARVTYGKSSRKRAQNPELDGRDFTSPPATPSIQLNRKHAVGGERSTTLPNVSKSPTRRQNKQRPDDHALEQKTSLPRNNPRPQSSRSKPRTQSRASVQSGYSNVYDVPSSGDEQSSAYGSGQKRRKLGTVGKESSSTPVTLPHRQQRPALPMPMKRTRHNNIAISNGGIDAPMDTQVEVVIEQGVRSSRESRSRHASVTSGRDTEEISREANGLPDPPSNPLRADKYTAGWESTSPRPTQSQPLWGGLQSRRRAGGYRRDESVDDKPIVATPGRRRLVDGLNASRPDVEDTAESATVGLRRSPTSSESSFVLSSSKDIEPLADTTSRGHNNQRPAAAQNSQAAGPRITYARQRSFLSEASMLENPEKLKISDSPNAPHNIRGRGEKSSTAGKRMPVEPSDETSITHTGAVRSIHELRQAGGNARFQGMIDSILEDIEDSLGSVSTKRSGLIQLCHKLTEYQSARQFVETGLEKRFADTVRDQTDLISSSLAVYACALLLSTGPTSNTTLSACCSVILELVPHLLGEEEDIQALTKNRRTKLSRAEQAALRDLCGQFATSRIWCDKPPSQISPQVMALRCLEMAVRKVREKGEYLEVISSSTLDQLVGILLRHSDTVKDTSTLPNDLLVLELVFSVLESYTVEMGSLGSGQELVIKRLSHLGPFLALLTKQGHCQSRQLQILNIRLILNVTNNNPPLCEDFATPDLTGALVEIIVSKFGLVSEDFIGERREPVLDIVILALGALINLAEWSETSRNLILKCQGESGRFIDGLLRLFTNGLDAIFEADSVVQTHANVAFGYLSVLLSTLCLNDEARSYLRQHLDRLLGTVDEFLRHYRKVEEEMHQPEPQDDPMAGFTSRLQGIVTRIRDLESGR